MQNKFSRTVFNKEKSKSCPQNKRLALLYEKSDLIFLAFIAVAIIKMNLC